MDKYYHSKVSMNPSRFFFMVLLGISDPVTRFINYDEYDLIDNSWKYKTLKSH